MQNKELIENAELEAMRAQLQLLKDHLDREEIVNEKLLRQAMKTNIHYINSRAWFSAVAGLMVVCMSFFYFPNLGLSWWFIAATDVLMLVGVFYTYKTHKGVSANMMNGDLITVAKRMHKVKTDYVNWYKIAIPLASAWTIWFIVELYMIASDWLFALSTIGGLLIGGLVGGLIGINMHKKTISDIDDIIQQAECKTKE